jgi:hypothetical protein
MSDAVNKPSHYNQGSIECIEAMKIVLTPEEFRGYLKGNVFKYLWREKDKNGIEDIRKGKSYFDRLIDLVDESEQQKSADLQSLPAMPIDGRRNSDKIPEGYRKLKDSSEEPRKLGDLRWSISQKRYVEIGEEEIGYANRDNWSACRKVEPVVKQSLTTEPPVGLRFRHWPSDSQESSTPEPPDGWRFLEFGEVLRKGDNRYKNFVYWDLERGHVGDLVSDSFNTGFIRRNRFEVGEKVIDCRTGAVSTVQHTDKQYPIVFLEGVTNGVESKHLAPYIEATE